MKILSIDNSNKNSNRAFSISPIKNRTYQLYKNSKRSLVEINKQVSSKSKNISPPLKYYLIGLAIPIPFASTVGLIYGTGVLLKEKLFNHKK